MRVTSTLPKTSVFGECKSVNLALQVLGLQSLSQAGFWGILGIAVMPLVQVRLDPTPDIHSSVQAVAAAGTTPERWRVPQRAGGVVNPLWHTLGNIQRVYVVIRLAKLLDLLCSSAQNGVEVEHGTLLGTTRNEQERS